MTGGVDGGEGLCGDTAEVLVRESQSLEIFCEESVKAVSEIEEGKGDKDLQSSDLFTVCQRR